MAIPPVVKEVCADIRELEQGKFVECPPDSGKPAVRVKICDEPLGVSFSPYLSGTLLSIAEYGSADSVVSGALTTVATYTVPALRQFVLYKVEASGENVAKYQVEIDSVVKGVKRTWWTDFNTEFNFERMELAAGAVVRVRVEHNSPDAGDFDATIIGVEGDTE